jgi:hypothetical protein
MAKKSSGSNSTGGGRKGANQSSTMTLADAMKLNKPSKSKPNLNGSLPMSNKVTNKPKMSGKRMK